MDLKEKIIDIASKLNYRIGIYANDLKGNEIKFHSDDIFETASCIKLFILIEYYRQVSDGLKNRKDIMEYTKEDNISNINSGIISSLEFGLKMTSKDYAILMIICSDNIATNKLIDYLGIENINNTIQKLGFKETIIFNKIDFSIYKKLGQTTPYEYALAYNKILSKELYSEDICNEILDILKKQKNNDMLIKGLPLYDVLFKGEDESKIKYIASKSGAIAWETDEIDNVRNDGGIISTNIGEYIISIFISGFSEMYIYYNNEAINIGSEIHRNIYNSYIKNKGNFLK
ncbi:MAG: class A beta-lactamase-related serine hydrolase [Clostridia bacterium]|nr:class A beta-lactamase-related serine hydrolase [Clostridia bacterium]MDD4387093.1 class A beta-lactamase-related serine hydrolase [Clostridia bacterium]